MNQIDREKKNFILENQENILTSNIIRFFWQLGMPRVPKVETTSTFYEKSQIEKKESTSLSSESGHDVLDVLLLFYIIVLLPIQFTCFGVSFSYLE